MVVDNMQAKVRMVYKISVPVALEKQLYFYLVFLLGRANGKKKQDNIHNSLDSTFACMTIQIA